MRSLKLWLANNWLLKIFSLFLATVLWMAVARESSSEIGLDVPLEYRNIPEHLEITGDAADSVHVRLRGSSNVIKGISPRDVSTTVDLANMRVGEKIVPLSPQNVQVPFGAEVIRVNPSSVRFNLEKTVTKSVLVVPTILGQPPDGYEIGEVLVNPDRVRIEGPESRVTAIDSIPTVPIRIDRLQEQAVQAVDLDVADPQIRLQRPSPVEIRLNVHKTR